MFYYQSQINIFFIIQVLLAKYYMLIIVKQVEMYIKIRPKPLHNILFMSTQNDIIIDVISRISKFTLK